MKQVCDSGARGDARKHGALATPSLLTVRDTATRLNVSIACVYTLLTQRLLPHIRIGRGRGTIRISESDLADFVEKNRVALRQQAANVPVPASPGCLKANKCKT